MCGTAQSEAHNGVGLEVKARDLPKASDGVME